MPDEQTIRDNADEHRYEIVVDGDLAGYAAYVDDDGGRRIFTHTKVDPDYAGHGVGGALAAGALDDARARGLRIVPRCPFITEFIQRHPDYADLVAK